MNKVIVIMTNNFLRCAIILFLMIHEFSMKVKNTEIRYKNAYGGEKSTLHNIKASPKLIKNIIINNVLTRTTLPPNNTGNYSTNLTKLCY